MDSAVDVDTIVIGAGVLGLSIAAERASDASTLVLEATNRVASAASLATFGCCNAHAKTPTSYERLALAGLDAHRRLSASAPPALHWYDEIGTDFDGRIEHGEGFADVPRYLEAVARRLAAAGGVRRDGAGVLRVSPASAKPKRPARVVLTSGETLTARHIVIAAGVETASLLPAGATGAARIGTARGPVGFVARVRDARLRPHTVVVTRALSLRPQHPDSPQTPNSSTSQFSTGGPVTSPANPDDELVMVQSLELEDELGERGVPPTRESTWPQLRDRIARKTGIDVAENALVSLEAAPRPLSADGLPVVGDVAHGVYVALAHSGITLAPIIGELLARVLETQTNDPLLTPFHPAPVAGH